MTGLPAGALEGLRVADLAGPYGNYCGKLYADLGADVVLVEPPEGAESRRRQPFTAEGESLWFCYHNANKRGVIAEPGSAALVAVIRGSDVVIGSGAAGWPSAWGIDLGALRREQPRLVVVSVTPFGLSGPYADFDGTDIVCLALGGLLALGGYGDGAPLQAAGEQALQSAQLFAAVGGAMAVLNAEATGDGQLVDVSAQESVAMALEHAIQYYDLEGITRGRQTGRQRGAGAGLYTCADGWVYLFVGGIASGRFWQRFVDWLRDEKAEGAAELSDPAWGERKYFDSAEAKETFLRIFETFTATRKREDLYHGAQSRGIPLAPVREPSEVVASEQLRLHEFFRPVATPDGHSILAPGAPYTLAETPWLQRRPAPRLGEHTAEILAGIQHG